MSKEKSRFWNKDTTPFRQIILWGWNDKGNPSFLTLYGKHEFKQRHSNELDDNVTYQYYIVNNGLNNHFPAFEPTAISVDYSYKARQYIINMYYKEDIKGKLYWQMNENDALKSFIKLEAFQNITFPYFEETKYEDYIEYIESNNIKFKNFRLAKSPQEVLKLDDDIFQYYDIICNIFSYPNLYMRRKYLKELINSNPSNKIYDFILNVGSSEIISGLFLELAMRKNDILIKKAEEIIKPNYNIDWTNKSYANGVKRCAKLYVNSMNEKIKAERIQWIHETLSDMDLHFLDTDIKNPEGKDYKEFADSGLLSEYNMHYSYEESKYVRKKRKKHYKENYYSDGSKLNVINVKNTLQEAEIYGLEDIIAKIAYYVDAPRLVYQFRANNNKGLMYFRRYIRRIFDSYAKTDEDKFIKAMKILFTSYNSGDYLCEYAGNFQYNYFIKHYLYNKYAIDIYSYHYPQDDQLASLEGRNEFMPKVWDRHIEDVVYIAVNSKIYDIQKACYYILKDSIGVYNFSQNLSYDDVITLVSSSCEPLADMFAIILSEKLNSKNEFDLEVMKSLLKFSNERIHKIAMSFFNRTNGIIPVKFLVEFILSNNLDDWIDLFKQNVEMLNSELYVEFVNVFLDKLDEFNTLNIVFSDNLKDILLNSIQKLDNISFEQKLDLTSNIISILINKQEISEFIFEFINKIIFEALYENIDNILQNIDIPEYQNPISEKNNLFISLLKMIKTNNLPTDSEIVNILETGTSRMVNALINIITQDNEKLNKRFSTLLIMLESDVSSLNKKAEDVFENMPQEQQSKLHSIIIDSPKSKVYSYGIQKLHDIYDDENEVIPNEFLVHMLEHSSHEVKAYASNKVLDIIRKLGNGNKELFIYYAKTILLLPNKISLSKKNIYNILPTFVNKYKDTQPEVEKILMSIGSSNIICDCENALVTLAKIKKEAI